VKPAVVGAISVLVLLTLIGLAPAHAQSADEPARIAAEIHARDQYADSIQMKQPDGTVASFPPGAGAGNDSGDARRFDRGAGRGGLEDRRQSDQRRGSPPETLPSFDLPHFDAAWLATLLQGLAALALLPMVVAVAMAVIRRGPTPTRPKTAPARPASPQPPEPDALPWEVDDPDSLFGQGRLGEAIVALLVQSLRVSGWAPERERGRTVR